MYTGEQGSIAERKSSLQDSIENPWGFDGKTALDSGDPLCGRGNGNRLPGSKRPMNLRSLLGTAGSTYCFPRAVDVATVVGAYGNISYRRRSNSRRSHAVLSQGQAGHRKPSPANGLPMRP